MTKDATANTQTAIFYFYVVVIEVVFSHNSSKTMASLSASTNDTHHSDKTFHPDVPVPNLCKVPDTPTTTVTPKQEKFTDDLECAVIDMWDGEPGLYDYTHELYHKIGFKEKKRKEIAEKLGSSVAAVKTRMETIRTSYTKAKNPPTSSKGKKLDIEAAVASPPL